MSSLLLVSVEIVHAGMIVSISGDVYINRGNRSFRAKGGEKVSIGDVVDSTLGKAVVLISDSQAVVLNRGMFKIQKIERTLSGYLFSGNGRWVVSSHKKEMFYTPTAVIQSNNANIIIKYNQNSDSTEIYQLEGESSVKNVKDEVKGKVNLSPLKITVVGKNKAPSSMLISLTINDRKKMMKEFSIIETFQDRYEEKVNLIKLAKKLYQFEGKKASIFIYPDNDPFYNRYTRSYREKITKLNTPGSIKIKWTLGK